MGMRSCGLQVVPGLRLGFVLSLRSDFGFVSDVENPLSGFFFLSSKK